MDNNYYCVAIIELKGVLLPISVVPGGDEVSELSEPEDQSFGKCRRSSGEITAF